MDRKRGEEREKRGGKERKGHLESEQVLKYSLRHSNLGSFQHSPLPFSAPGPPVLVQEHKNMSVFDKFSQSLLSLALDMATWTKSLFS